MGTSDRGLVTTYPSLKIEGRSRDVYHTTDLPMFMDEGAPEVDIVILSFE